MSKKKTNDLFGDVGALPDPVNREQLGASTIADGDYLPYQEVDEADGLGLDDLGDMLSDNIADDLLGGVEELDEESNDELGGEDPAMNDDDLLLEDAIDADMIYEVWADIRLGLHTEGYDWAIYKNPKEAKKVLRELGLKNNKTTQEQALYQKLFDYVEQHDSLRDEYRQSVPYTEKHKELFLKYIEKEIQKARMKGKKFPTWLVVAYLFIWPEIKAGAKFWKIRQEIPDLKVDFNL